ncbi:hypothetical protein BA011_26665 (plasmid) [Rhizobium leguminosarum]|uniref:Uncharacterized protein n=1 Tax=Rhizobium leguminosarum TaxID=384 RepID=A0A1B1CHV7_RHILE|nr:hypothetical protein BA011_26665 [Rhizobium leguminosarum]
MPGATRGTNNLTSVISEWQGEATEREAIRIAARLKPTAEHLRDTIDAKLSPAESASARSRMSIAEILKQTVQDPTKVGLV